MVIKSARIRGGREVVGKKVEIMKVIVEGKKWKGSGRKESGKENDCGGG